MCVYVSHLVLVESTVAVVVAVTVSPKKRHNLTILARNKRGKLTLSTK